MEGPDLYTPWREPAAVLRARHVGRNRELDALRRGVTAFASGGHPLPIYFFGPRGVGKSHLLKVVFDELEAKRVGRVRMVVIGEDIPAMRSAEELIDRMRGDGTDRWMRWGKPRARSSTDEREDQRTIVFLEGFDRQLDALGKEGRRTLRRHLDEREHTWLVATGVALSGELTGKEEAFYGAFDAWPVEPLSEEDGGALLDRAAGEASQDPRWPARRSALLTLAGGSARALLALGHVCRGHPERWASEQLGEVVRQFTAHYQMRFRDLSPQNQRIVELLSEAPRELTPTEIGGALGVGASQTSVQANRMVADGVLRSRSEGRQSWYAIAEPLFRFWLEYRNARWDETRVGRISRLIEQLLSPPELVEAWWQHPEQGLRDAAFEAVRRSSAAQAEAWSRLLSDTAWSDEASVRRALERASQLPFDLFELRFAIAAALNGGHGEVVAAVFGGRLVEAGASCAPLVALLDLDTAVRTSRRAVRARFMALVRLAAGSADAWPVMKAAMICLDRVEGGARPWVLKPAERSRLARTLVVRAELLWRGLRRTDPPLLEPADLVGRPNADVDAADVMSASATAVARAAGERSRAATKLLEESAALVRPRLVQPCPVPGRLNLGAADSISAALVGAIRGNRRATFGLSWIASAAEATPEAWARLRAAVRDQKWSSPPEQTADRMKLAFAGLALASEARFAELRDAMKGASHEWIEILDDSELLAGQLRAAEGGALHPELERLRQALIG